MEEVRCRRCQYVHLGGVCPHEDAPRPNLPPADPWDKRTGVKTITDFEVHCHWTPIDNEWALVQPYVKVRDEVLSLAKDAEVFRVHRQVHGVSVESPELSALSWTESAVARGGLVVHGLYERDPGHVDYGGGTYLFRWWARVGSRLSVAVVRLDGDMSGVVRLVPVS